MKHLSAKDWKELIKNSSHHCEGIKLIGYCFELDSYLFRDTAQNITIAISSNFVETLPEPNE